MSLNLVSPGVKVREVDLTIGNISGANEQVGAIAGPFERGPVEVPTLIETEQDLLATFGEPQTDNNQFEYWMSASSYLSYGGVLRVVRADNTNLKSANVSVNKGQPVGVDGIVSLGATTIRTAGTYYYTDADSGTGFQIGIVTTAGSPTVAITTIGKNMTDNQTVTIVADTSGLWGGGTANNVVFNIDGVTNGQKDLKIKSYEDYNDNQVSPTTWLYAAKHPGSWANNLKVCTVDAKADQIISIGATQVGPGLVGLGVTQSLETRKEIGDGVTSDATGFLRGVIVGVSSEAGKSEIHVKITDTVDITGSDWVSTSAEYSKGGNTAFISTEDITVVNTSGSGAAHNGGFTADGKTNPSSVVDWYDQQTLGLDNATVYWKSIAEKPATSEYAKERSGKNDEMHVVVVDDKGTVTGTAGNIIEKFLNLSKASDGKISPAENIYYRDSIANKSQYIYAGAAEVDNENSTGLVQASNTVGFTLAGVGNWGSVVQGRTFSGVGATVYNLTEGQDYSASGGYGATLANIVSGYDQFKNQAEYDIDFLIQGPSGGSTRDESSAKARKLIAIAEQRKDCVACISPHRGDVVNIADSDTQTDNIIDFFDPLPSSSYAVFDSGYKYAFDRFNNKFRYIPLNADIAGLMARTSINQYSWFSPAGAARGAINGAIKLAYNPSKAQRDAIYPKRINPVIASPGQGIVLFGDKTGLGYASAFDRINVRRLFLTIESTIEKAAKDQLFEFNDVITRSSFLNIVDPYLRDVKAKRGVTDYVVICDETNNTPDIIDSNQFRADIFVKPNRSINFIGLSFVATRTGVSFEEVVGNV